MSESRTKASGEVTRDRREERPYGAMNAGPCHPRFSSRSSVARSLVTRYAHHPLLSRPDRAQPGALRAASGRGRGWE